MPINYASPTLDFDIEAEALINALKGAREDAATVAPVLRRTDWTPGAGALGGVGAALTRMAGGMGEQRVMGERRALAAEELRRFDELQRELNTPGTVKLEQPAPPPERKIGLRAGGDVLQVPGAGTEMPAQPSDGLKVPRGMAPLMPDGVPIPDQTGYEEFAPEGGGTGLAALAPDNLPTAPGPTSRPMTALEDNARRMKIAQQMSRLPMARKMADQLWQKGIAFPETMAQLQMKAAEAAAARQEKLAADERQNAILNEIRAGTLKVAQTNAATQQAAQQARQADVETKAIERQEAKRQADEAQIASASQAVAEIDAAIGRRGPDGKLLEGERPAPGFEDYIGFTYLPFASKIDGTDAANFKSRVDQLTGNARLAGVQQMKGTGAVSNAEGEAAARAIMRANKSQSEREFVQAMLEYRAVLETGISARQRGVRRIDTPNGVVEVPDTSAASAAPAAPAAISRGAPAERMGPPQVVLQRADGKTFVKGADGKWYTR